jgi:hypothetical protein
MKQKERIAEIQRTSKPPVQLKVPRPENGETWQALRDSVDSLELEMVKSLIDAGVSVNMPHEGHNNEPSFLTLLHSLCNRLVDPSTGESLPDALAIMEVLLNAGANVNPRSSVGCTPLMRACTRKNVEAVQLLLQRQADPNIEDDLGLTAIRLAIQLESFGCSCGVDLDELGEDERRSTAHFGDHNPLSEVETVYGFHRKPLATEQAVAAQRDGSVSGKLVKLLLDCDSLTEGGQRELDAAFN